MSQQYVFQDAVRDDTSLLIAIAGASGSGKTMSALRMATGLAQGDPIYFIDTEAKRGLHYAESFTFKHMDMKPPFTPEAFAGAIQAAEKQGAKVIIIDSFSDEYEGVGGLQEMHDDEVARLARKPFDQLEGWMVDKYNAPGWKIPKTRHKTKLIAPLRQVRAYVIFCLRAEEKIRFVKVPTENGREKTAIENAGWVPICEKRLPYDMTMAFTVTPDAPGIPLIRDGEAVYGKMQKQHLAFFAEGQQVDENVGQKIRAWARGESAAANTSSTSTPPASAAQKAAEPGSESPPAQPGSAADIPLLIGYNKELAGEAFREALEEAHNEFRPRFAGASQTTTEAAKKILRIHQDRVASRLTAEKAGEDVQIIIDGLSA